MSTPQPPHGHPEQPIQPPPVPPANGAQQPAGPQYGTQPPAGPQYGAQPPYGAQQPAGPPPPAGPPAPQQGPRPGRTLPTLALVCAIAGVAVVCLGFLSFIPSVGRVLGYISFVGWAFLIAGLVLSIVALVKKAAAKGMSIAALIVSIAGGVVGIVAAIVVGIAGVLSYTSTVIDEYGDLLPSEPGDSWSVPEGSGDPDVEADCATLLAADPGTSGAAGGLENLFDDLADQMTTDEVRIPLEDLADAYEDLSEMGSPGDMADASAALERAAADLGTACGFDASALQ